MEYENYEVEFEGQLDILLSIREWEYFSFKDEETMDGYLSSLNWRLNESGSNLWLSPDGEYINAAHIVKYKAWKSTEDSE